MGGGSSNAAQILLGINKLYDLQLSTEQLADIGKTLGADIPVCIASAPSTIKGVGDEVIPVANFPPNIPILLVNHGEEITAQEAYQNHTIPYSKPLENITIPSNSKDLMQFLQNTRNDLEPCAIEIAPTIKKVLAAIKAQPGCELSRMSGSGATCFGIFESADQLATAAQNLKQDNPSWWIRATALI